MEWVGVEIESEALNVLMRVSERKCRFSIKEVKGVVKKMGDKKLDNGNKEEI